MLLRTIAAACALVLCAGFASAPPRIDYTLTPVLEGGALKAIEVDVSFRGEADGSTGLTLPSSWGGEEALWRGIENLTIVSGAELHDGDSPSSRVLTHRPNARIHLRYRVIQDWEGVPTASGGNPYRPVIQPTYFHLIGEAALVYPDLAGNSPVRVQARGLPRGWSFASDLQHRRLTLDQAHASVIVGGDYRIITAPSDPNIRIAIRGEWTFTDADFTAQVTRIIQSERAFWNDGSTPYLVTVTQIATPNPGSYSIGGTGLDDAFAFFATPNGKAQQIARTLAHEGLHTWIPRQLGGAPQENEALVYWLSEGFTDFYTGRLLVRAGLWGPAEFAEDFNAMLSAYDSSPVLNEPNSRILADFWNVQAVGQLPYQRGRLLATIWDARLRAGGQADMDDVVFTMRRLSGTDHGHVAELFPAAAGANHLVLGDDITTYVENGATIMLPEDVFAPCGRIVTRDVPNFHRGFDIAATQSDHNVIHGVNRAGPAYAAGMRDGMVLIRRDAGEIGDATQEITYIVRDGETERAIRYIPRGEGTFKRQTFELASPLEGETLTQCVRVLGGN